MTKTALIFGATGMDGSYLSEFLLQMNYTVVAVYRRSSSNNLSRIEHLRTHPNFRLELGDITDAMAVSQLINQYAPIEVYNLAAQSHVQVSFEIPNYTAQCDAIGTLNVLDAIQRSSRAREIKFYQASTSELYGDCQVAPQNESTPFNCQSPYAVAKLFSYHMTQLYRRAYGIFACNGILFNHTSVRQDPAFVLRKITQTLRNIIDNINAGRPVVPLRLGNLNSRRDFGHAQDYVRAMWLMLNQPNVGADDYVIATGRTTTIRDLVCITLDRLGMCGKVNWEGEGVNERVIHTATGTIIMEIDPTLFRPAEVPLLLGDCSKATAELGWIPEWTLDDILAEMIGETEPGVRLSACSK